MVKDFTAIIEQDEDGMYVGRVPQLRGCVTQGKTIDELVERLKDAVRLYINENSEIEMSKFIGTQQIQV